MKVEARVPGYKRVFEKRICLGDGFAVRAHGEQKFSRPV
jgi:hypothetical protein